MHQHFIYIRNNLYRLWKVRYFILILLSLFLLNLISNSQSLEVSWQYFSADNNASIIENSHWLFFYLTPVLLPFNFFGQLLSQLPPSVYVRMKEPTKLFGLTFLIMASYILVYIMLIILVLTFLGEPSSITDTWQVTYLVINLFLTLMGLLSLETAGYCLGMGQVGLAVTLALLIYSFYSNQPFKWAMTQPFEEISWKRLLLRFLIMLLMVGLCYIIYCFLPRIRKGDA